MRQKQNIVFLILVVVLGVALALAGLIKLYNYKKAPHVMFSDWVAVKPIAAKNAKKR